MNRRTPPATAPQPTILQRGVGGRAGREQQRQRRRARGGPPGSTASWRRHRPSSAPTPGSWPLRDGGVEVDGLADEDARQRGGYGAQHPADRVAREVRGDEPADEREGHEPRHVERVQQRLLARGRRAGGQDRGPVGAGVGDRRARGQRGRGQRERAQTPGEDRCAPQAHAAHPLRPASGKCYGDPSAAWAASPSRLEPGADGVHVALEPARHRRARRRADREDRAAAATGRRRGGRAAPRPRPRARRACGTRSRAPASTRRSARPVSAPLSAARRRHALARAARAQHEQVGRAVGQRGAERDRRGQPGVDEAPAVDRDRRPGEQRQRGRGAQREPQRRRVARPSPWRSTASARLDVGGERVQLGRAPPAPRRTAPARAARSAPRPAARRRPPGPRRGSPRRREISSPTSCRVGPGRDPVAHAAR